VYNWLTLECDVNIQRPSAELQQFKLFVLNILVLKTLSLYMYT